MDMRRPPNGDLASWRFVGAEGLTFVDGLYKLRIDKRPLTARNLEITSEDLVLQLSEGTVFRVECDDGVTGLILLGRGLMTFSPTAAAERGQLRLFSGNDTLTSPFESAFVRLSPSDYSQRVAVSSLTEAAPDARQVQTRRGSLRGARREIVQRRPAGSQPGRLVPASAHRRLSRRSRDASLRHADLHADGGAGRGHQRLSSKGPPDARALSVGRQARRTRPLLQRRRAARLRRPRLQRRGRRSIPSAERSEGARGC